MPSRSLARWPAAVAAVAAGVALGPARQPAVDRPTPFDTPEADAVAAALRVFPPDNPWNTPVDGWPVHPNSPAIVRAVGADKPLRYNPDMGYVFVPPGQPKVRVDVVGYKDESDPGPFPVPDDVPIEGWPARFRRDPGLRGLTLADAQRGKPNPDEDRHAIVVDPGARKLYEFAKLTRTAGGGWAADQASVFDLGSNKLRPAGWTSADAAGLPIFPAVVRHDELARGEVRHALRVTVRRTRKAYVYPATHYASRLTDPTLPRMGERFRLRKGFDTTRFGPQARAILEALKRYGMLVADNGIEWAVSVAPDERIPPLHDELRKVKGADFEVVTPPPGYRPPR